MKYLESILLVLEERLQDHKVDFLIYSYELFRILRNVTLSNEIAKKDVIESMQVLLLFGKLGWTENFLKVFNKTQFTVLYDSKFGHCISNKPTLTATNSCSLT